MFSINGLYSKWNEVVLFVDKNNLNISGSISLFAGYTFPCAAGSTIIAVHDLWYHLVWDKVFENIARYGRFEWLDNSGGGFKYKVYMVRDNIFVQNSRSSDVYEREISAFLVQWRRRRDEIISFKSKLYEQLIALRGGEISGSLATGMWVTPPGYLPSELSDPA